MEVRYSFAYQFGRDTIDNCFNGGVEKDISVLIQYLRDEVVDGSNMFELLLDVGGVRGVDSYQSLKSIRYQRGESLALVNLIELLRIGFLVDL